jgi:hypothetical protein
MTNRTRKLAHPAYGELFGTALSAETASPLRASRNANLGECGGHVGASAVK